MGFGGEFGEGFGFVLRGREVRVRVCRRGVLRGEKGSPWCVTMEWCMRRISRRGCHSRVRYGMLCSWVCGSRWDLAPMGGWARVGPMSRTWRDWRLEVEVLVLFVGDGD